MAGTARPGRMEGTDIGPSARSEVADLARRIPPDRGGGSDPRLRAPIRAAPAARLRARPGPRPGPRL